MDNNLNTSSMKARVGIMACGHREYWPQFPGMKDELIQNSKIFSEIVKEAGVEILDCVFVDNPEDSYNAGVKFKSKDIDLLFVYLTTYVASGRYIQGVLAAACPVVLVGLQKQVSLKSEFTIQSMTGAGSPCQMPEAYSAMLRCGKPAVVIIFGELTNDSRVRREIHEWCLAAMAVRGLKGSTFGYMGHTYEGMLDMNFDPTAITRQFGVHVKFVEMCELVRYVSECSQAELNRKLDDISNIFNIENESYDPTTKTVLQDDLEWSARCAAGLDHLVENNKLSGLAYYYVGEDGSIYERIASNLATEREGLESYQIGYFVKGEGYLEYRGQKNCIKKGDIMWIDCRDAYCSYFESEEAETIWVHFNGSIVKSYFDHFYSNNGNNAVMHSSGALMVPYKIKMLIDIYKNGSDSISELKAAEILYSIMIEIITSLTKDSQKEVGSLYINKALTYIHENFSKKFTLDDIAENINISKYYLSRLFTGIIGVPVKEYLLQYRINKAKELFHHSTYHVSEVSEMTGFEDVSYFIRIFRRYEGITPNEYKKKWK